ncbi:MAG: GNAT family N-acetyltransferase [Rhodospirillaceae bacterium]
MTDVIIRLARAEERQALEDLQRRSSLAFERYRAALLAHPDAIVLPLEQIEAGRVQVAEREGMLLGFSVVLPAVDDGAELDGLFVDPAVWRQGIGRRLLRAAERLAGSEGAKAISVIANQDALEFYAACSFTQVGETQTRFGPAPRLRKPLAAAR